MSDEEGKALKWEHLSLANEELKQYSDHIYSTKENGITIQKPVILPSDRLSSASPSTSDDPSSIPMEGGHSFIVDLPSEVLLLIVEFLEIKDRARLAMTCRHFQRYLTEAKFTLQRIAVMNIFQKRIWQRSVSSNTISRLVLYKIPTARTLASLLRHIGTIDSLKIWFESVEFVKSVLEVFTSSVRIRCVDVYPYSTELPLDQIHTTFPKLNAITMRPHGTDHFYKGLELSYMPLFSNLTTFCVDSFEPIHPFQFPPMLKTLEFAHRKLDNFDYFIQSLAKLSHLECLSLTHLQLSGPFRFQQLLQAISMDRMKRLSVLIFRFCHMSPITLDLEQNVRFKLKVIKFDLAYGLSPVGVYGLINFCSEKLTHFTMNMMLEDVGALQTVFDLSPLLKQRGVKLQLSIMQKDEKGRKEVVPKVNYMADMRIPDEFYDVLCKFEGSFVWSKEVFATIFSKECRSLMEAKFIKSASLDNSILYALAVSARQLRRITIISCDDCDDMGLIHFTENIMLRAVDVDLTVFYKNNGSLTTLFGELLLRSTPYHIIHNQTKTFHDGISHQGQYVYFKDTKHNRVIEFKNYNPEDSNILLGLVVDTGDGWKDESDIDMNTVEIETNDVPSTTNSPSKDNLNHSETSSD